MSLIQIDNTILCISQDTEITAKKTGAKGQEQILLCLTQGSQFAHIWFDEKDLTKILRDINNAVLMAMGSEVE